MKTHRLNGLVMFVINFLKPEFWLRGWGASSNRDVCDSFTLLDLPMCLNFDLGLRPLSIQGDPPLQAFFKHLIIRIIASATTSGLASFLLRRSQSFWHTPAGTWEEILLILVRLNFTWTLFDEIKNKLHRFSPRTL